MSSPRLYARIAPALVLLLAAAGVTSPRPGLAIATQPDLAVQADAYFSRLVRHGFSGSVLIALGGEEILHRGYGLADDAAGVPVGADTIFSVESITKQFTAAAILHLEMRGRLQVDDTISTLLPDVPKDKAGITLHHLLTHTAGFRREHFAGDLDPMSRDEALQAILALPLEWEPGAHYHYSNTGYTLLAIVIERVSGQSYQSYLMEHLFTPAGMTSSGFFGDPRWESLHVATGYVNGRATGTPDTFPGPYWGLLGNGGVMSTTKDLYRWVTALQRHLVLSEEQVDKLFAPHVPEGSGDSYYGYGWTIVDTLLGRLITHNGGGLGGNSDLAMYVDRDLVIAITSNRITYRIPLEVRLPATEAREQLAANIHTGDWSSLPRPTLPIYYSLGAAALLAAILAVVVWLVVRHGRRQTGRRRTQ